MARVSAGGRTGSALTAAFGPQLVPGVTTQDLILREVGIFNTTTTGCAVGIARTTTQGTAGAALTEVNESHQNHTIIGVATNIASGATVVGGVVRQASLGAAIGSGVIWTFGDQGLIIPGSTTLGVTIICPTGTGQIVDFYFVFDE
jgi:hypothetical protein